MKVFRRGGSVSGEQSIRMTLKLPRKVILVFIAHVIGRRNCCTIHSVILYSESTECVHGVRSTTLRTTKGFHLRHGGLAVRNGFRGTGACEWPNPVKIEESRTDSSFGVGNVPLSTKYGCSSFCAPHNLAIVSSGQGRLTALSTLSMPIRCSKSIFYPRQNSFENNY